MVENSDINLKIQNKYENKVFLLVKIKKHFPSNKLFFIMLFPKLLSLIVITHDWNVNKKRVISFWIRKFTLSEIISKYDSIYIYYIILFIIFIWNLLATIFFFKISNSMKFNGYSYQKNKIKVKFIAFFFIYIIIFFSQFIFSIYIEILAYKKINKVIYYIIFVLIIIITIYNFLLNILISSVLIRETIFYENSTYFINEINKIYLGYIYYNIFQIIIQLEFHLKFKYLLIIKIIIRILYCIVYIKDFFLKNFYYSIFFCHVFIKFIHSICFVSCLIELAFLYESNDEKTLLISNKSIIIIKIIIELILGYLLTKLFYYLDDKKNIINLKNFNHNNPEYFNYQLIKIFNVFYFHNRKQFLRNILNEINIKLSNSIHKPLCSKNIFKAIYNNSEKNYYCYNCHIYNSESFTKQINKYFVLINQKNQIKDISIKNDFSLLYKMFENEIKNYNDSNNLSPKKNLISIIVIFMFYFIFEKNYLKCLYLLTKLKYNQIINLNLIGKIQIEVLKEKILKTYKNYLLNKYGKKKKIILIQQQKEYKMKIYQTYLNYRIIDKLIYLERIYKQFLNNYINIMNIFSEEKMTLLLYQKIVKKFKLNYQNIIDKTKHFLKNSTCIINYNVDKFLIFYNYFNGEIPDSIKNTIKTFFCFNNISSIDKIENKNILILSLKINKNIINFKIKYASDNLIKQLKYSIEEFKNLDISNLFPKTFIKAYKFSFRKLLNLGEAYNTINNFCLLDKNQYIILYNIVFTQIYKKNETDIYINLKEAKEQLLINQSKQNKKNLEFKNNESKDSMIGSCFLFTNQNGKILNLSRGFEEFFFLNSEVLTRYNINILDLFKIENKLLPKGKFEKYLFDIYENIYEIFMREVGQIGEDSFSKVIFQIEQLKHDKILMNKKYKIIINYEMKNIQKNVKKKKEYYLFVINIIENKSTKYPKSIKNKKSFLFTFNTSTILSSDFETFIDNKIPNLSEKIDIFPKLSSNADNHQILEKIFSIHKLSCLILNKFFRYNSLLKNYKVPKKIKNENIEETNNIFNNNYQNNNKNNSNLVIKLNKEKLQLKKTVNFGLTKYHLIVILNFIFIIGFLVIFILKKEKINQLTEYVYVEGDLIMVSNLIAQILINIILMQFQANSLQLNNYNNYNNSYEYNYLILKERIVDYLYFNNKYKNFYKSNYKNLNINKSEILTYYNYVIPDIYGGKQISIDNNLINNIHIILMNINEPLIIYYNNSDEFYNLSTVSLSNLTPIEYYKKSKSYIMMIVTYSKYFNYHFNKIILIFRTFLNEKLLDKKNLLALVNLIIGLGFCILNTLQYFCFYNKSLILYCKYFYFHLQLLFFNNYLLYKSKLIFYYLYNNSNKFNIMKKINEIEIIDNNNQVELLNNLIINEIGDFKSIRINAFSTKLKEENKKKLTNEVVFKEDNLKENVEIKLSKDINENEIVDQNSVYSILKNKNKISSKNLLNSKKRFNKNYFTVNTNNKMLNKNFFETTNSNELNNNFPNKKRSMLNFVSKNFNNNNSTNLNLSNSNASYNELVSNNNKTNSSVSNLNKKNNSPIKKKVIVNDVIKKKKKIKLNENDITYFNKTGNKLLNKQIIFLCFLIEYLILIILFLLIFIINLLFTRLNTKNFKEMNITRDIIFIQYNYLSLFLIDYFISVLSNEVLTIENDYIENLNTCHKNLNKTSKIRNVFDDILSCYSPVKNQIDEIVNGKINKNLDNMKKLLLKRNDDNFCGIYSNYFIDNLDNEYMPNLTFLYSMNETELYNECINMGGGLNKKGLDTAISTIYENIINYYNDFENDLNRTEESNLNRLNYEFLYAIQFETTRVFNKITVIYYITFLKDFNILFKKLKKFENLMFSFEIIIIIIIELFFIINIHNFWKEIREVDFFNNCVLNTIIFN